MKKRRRLLAMFLALMIWLLTGCGNAGKIVGEESQPSKEVEGEADPDNGQGDTTVAVPGLDADTAVEITLYYRGGVGAKEALQTCIDEFNKTFPYVQVTFVLSDDLVDEIRGGTPPNIAFCRPEEASEYIALQSLVMLDEFINSTAKIEGLNGEVVGFSTAQRDDFVQGFYDEGAIYGDGKMYTLPLRKFTEVLYYNKTFFEKNNLKVPTTWEEMWDVCEKIKKIDPACFPLTHDSISNWFITMDEQMGLDKAATESGAEALFGKAENQAFMQELRDYYQKGYFTTKELRGGSFTDDLFVETTGKKSYMCIASSSGATYLMSDRDTGDGAFAFEVGTAPVPQVDVTNPKMYLQGENVCVMKGRYTTDEQVLASWLFVKFLCTNVDFQIENAKRGFVPTLRSASSNLELQSWLNEANGKDKLIPSVVKVGLDCYDALCAFDVFKRSNVVAEEIEKIALKCLPDPKADIDAAFEDAIQNCKKQQ